MLVNNHQDNPALMDILKEQKVILERQKENVDMLKDSISSLNSAETRPMQDAFIAKIESAYGRLLTDTDMFRDLSQYFNPFNEKQADNSLKSKEEWHTLINTEKERSAASSESEPEKSAAEPQQKKSRSGRAAAKEA